MNSVSPYVKPILPFDCPSGLHSFSVLCGLGFVKRSNTFYEEKLEKILTKWLLIRIGSHLKDGSYFGFFSHIEQLRVTGVAYT